MKYLTLQTVTRDGVRHRAHTEIELPDDTAARLLGGEQPAIARLVPTAAPAAPAPGENAKLLIGRIRAMTSTADTAALQAAELAREDGPRKTVLEAIQRRDDEIGAGDDGRAEGDAA